MLKTSRTKFARPRLEGLEARYCPVASLRVWEGDSTVSPTDAMRADNWSGDVLPKDGDTVEINSTPTLSPTSSSLNSLLVSISDEKFVHSRTAFAFVVTSTVTVDELVLTNADIKLSGSASFDVWKKFDLNGGRVTYYNPSTGTGGLYVLGNNLSEDTYTVSTARSTTGNGDVVLGVPLTLGRLPGSYFGACRLDVGDFNNGKILSLTDGASITVPGAHSYLGGTVAPAILNMMQSTINSGNSGWVDDYASDGASSTIYVEGGILRRVPPITSGEEAQAGPYITARVEVRSGGTYLIDGQELRHGAVIDVGGGSYVQIKNGGKCTIDSGSYMTVGGASYVQISYTGDISELVVYDGSYVMGGNAYNYTLTVARSFELDQANLAININPTNNGCSTVVVGGTTTVDDSDLIITVVGGGQANRSISWDFILSAGSISGSGFSVLLASGSFSSYGYLVSVVSATPNRYRIASL